MRERQTSIQEQIKVFPERTIIARTGDKGQYMVCIGINGHTNNPNNPFFSLFNLELAKFFMVTKEHAKRVAIIEGYNSEPFPLEQLREQVIPLEPNLIRMGGETLLLRAYAELSDIEIVSPEPKNFKEARVVANTFPVDAIMLYYFMRLGPQMHRSGIVAEDQVREYLQTRLDTMKENLIVDGRFANFDFSYDHLVKLFAQEYKGRVFSVKNPEDDEFLRSQTFLSAMPPKPKWRENRIRKVARAVNHIREQELLAVITHYWNDGYSIIGEEGKVHLDNILKELEKLGTEARHAQIHRRFYPTEKDVRSELKGK